MEEAPLLHAHASWTQIKPLLCVFLTANVPPRTADMTSANTKQSQEEALEQVVWELVVV